MRRKATPSLRGLTRFRYEREAMLSARRSRPHLETRTALEYEMRVYPKRYHDSLIRCIVYHVTKRYRVLYNNIARGRL